MDIRKIVRCGVLCALVFTGPIVAESPASTYWQGGDVTGGVLTSGTTLMTGSSDEAKIAIGFGVVACVNNTITMTVGASGGSTTSVTLNAMTWQSCSENFFPIDVNVCQAVAPFPTGSAVASGDTGGGITFTNLKVKCVQQSTNTACYYMANSAPAAYTNTQARLATFSGFALVRAAGASDDLGTASCGHAGSGTFKFTGVKVAGTTTTAVLNNKLLSFLHAGSATNNVIPAGGTILPRKGHRATLTLDGIGSVNCGVNTFALASGNSGTPSIDGELDAFSFLSCLDTLPVINLASCGLGSPMPTVSISANGLNGGSMAVSNIAIRCALYGNPNACYYRAATANGTYVNSGGTLTFNSVAITHNATGATDDVGALCGSTGSMSTSFTDVTTAGSPTVILNQSS